MITTDKEFFFVQNGQRIVAPIGSEIYVMVQDFMDGDVGAVGLIQQTVGNIKQEVGRFGVGRVVGLKMDAPDILSQCHTAVKTGLELANPTLTFTINI